MRYRADIAGFRRAMPEKKKTSGDKISPPYLVFKPKSIGSGYGQVPSPAPPVRRRCIADGVAPRPWGRRGHRCFHGRHLFAALW